MFNKSVIIAFLSSRTNLTLLQCILYLIVGYVIGKHLDWIQMGIMFILLFGIQFVTRTKAVADGMVLRQLMVNYNLKANEIVEKIKDSTYLEIKNGKHLCNIECADDFNRNLELFIDKNYEEA